MGISHVQVPRDLNECVKEDRYDELKQLEHGDQVIYAAIRININKSRTCRPYYTTIAKMLGCSVKRVSDAVDRLVSTKFIEKRLIIEGEKQHYEFYFPKSKFDDHFERFTREFLNLEIPLNIKEYYMCIQPFLHKQSTGKGICTFSNNIIAQKTHWSVASVKRYNTWLIEHNYLDEEITNAIDDAGLPVIQKSFNLESLNQAVLWAKAVTKQVSQNTEDIEELRQKNADQQEQIDTLKKEVAALKKENALKRNYVEPQQEYDF